MQAPHSEERSQLVRTANRATEGADSQSRSVEVSRAVSAEDVLAVANKIAAFDTRTALVLDLDKITGLEPNRMSPQWGSVLTNILLGSLADLSSVKVRLPLTESAQRQVARSGLFFALSRHPDVSLTQASHNMPDVLTRWRQDWRPSDFEQTLFSIPGEEDADYPQELGTDLVAFLNPNLRPVTSSAEDVDSVVYPWLRKLLSKARIQDAQVRKEVLRNVSFATNELLSNVRDHAGIGYDGKCAISLFATGKSEMDSRIYVSVVDDGVGMPSTLQGRSESDETDCELVSKAFSGDLPRRHRGRGEGLAIVRDIADRYAGSIFAATGPTSQGSIVYEHSNGPEGTTKCRAVPNLEVAGTVIVLSLPTSRMAVKA